MWQITAPHFCAALVALGTKVLKPAPILNWTRDYTLVELNAYCRRKGWAMRLVGTETL